MSLTLRKTAQVILDQHNLQNTHCRMNDAKYMVIAGPCGQPVVSIPGIQFSKRDPTIKEVDYAAELLDAFLGQHKKKVEEFIKFRTAFLAMPARENIEEIDGIDLEHTHSYGRAEMYEKATFRDHLEGDDNWFTYTITGEGKVKLTLNGNISLQELHDYIPKDSQVMQAVDLITDYKTYFDAERAMNEAKSSMNQCDV